MYLWHLPEFDDYHLKVLLSCKSNQVGSSYGMFSKNALYQHLKEATIGIHLAKVLRCSINVVFFYLPKWYILRHTLGYMQKTQFEPKLREYLLLLSFVPSCALHCFNWVRKVAIWFDFTFFVVKAPTIPPLKKKSLEKYICEKKAFW